MNNLQSNTIPQWNLDSLYPSINTTQYKDALKNYSLYIDTIDKILQNNNLLEKTNTQQFDFTLWLKEYLTASNKKESLEKSLFAYAYIIYSTDTTNKELLDNMTRLEKISLSSKKQEIVFQNILVKYKTQLSAFFEKYPEYKNYEYILKEKITGAQHLMNAELENLASDLQRNSSDAWSRLQEQLISHLKDENTGKTFNELRNDAYSDNPAIRKSSWEKEITLLKQNDIAFAASLNNLKATTITLNTRRHWETPIDKSIFASRMQKKTLTALISAIEDSLPMWRSYFQAKAAILKKTNAAIPVTGSDSKSKGLSFYDLFAPIPGKQENSNSLMTKKWTFKETEEYIVSKFSSFSEKMGNFAKKAFDQNWIDAQVRIGKVGGAYCEDFPLQGESRILSNFTGAFYDVITLAHELGHAFHHDCIKNYDSLLSDYPMTLAETASTFAETLIKRDIISHSEGTEKIQLIDLELQDVSQVLVDILCRYYFEESVFKACTTEELTASDFCRLMKDAQEKTYGNGLNNNRHEYMWAIKSHYYISDLDFYNFPYAFGQLFASALYLKYKKQGKSFSENYVQLLSKTGFLSCEEIGKLAGFDITTKEFWKSSIDQFAESIEELKNYNF